MLVITAPKMARNMTLNLGAVNFAVILDSSATVDQKDQNLLILSKVTIAQLVDIVLDMQLIMVCGMKAVCTNLATAM